LANVLNSQVQQTNPMLWHISPNIGFAGIKAHKSLVLLNYHVSFFTFVFSNLKLKNDSQRTGKRSY